MDLYDPIEKGRLLASSRNGKKKRDLTMDESRTGSTSRP